MKATDKECRDTPGRCDPCEGLDRGASWDAEVELTYPGFIANASELRQLIGNPSDDPYDPAGFVTDDELNRIIARHRAIAKGVAERRNAEQRVQVEGLIDGKMSELDAAEAKQEFLRKSRLQQLEAALASAEKALEVDVDRMTEAYIQNGLPEDAASYYDEVSMPLVASPTVRGTSYGFIEEPYVARMPLVMNVSAMTEAGPIPYSPDPEIERTLLFSNLFTPRRFEVRGRYMYVTNGGEDLEEAIVWLTTKDRIEEFAERASEFNVPLAEIRKTKEEYEEDPVTEADPEVAASLSAIVELCIDPPILTDDELIADLVPQFNQEMKADAGAALQASAQVTNLNQAAPDN